VHKSKSKSIKKGELDLLGNTSTLKSEISGQKTLLDD